MRGCAGPATVGRTGPSGPCSRRRSQACSASARTWSSTRPIRTTPSQRRRRSRTPFRTPLDTFYSRNHGPIPELDPTAWQLRVDGLVTQPLVLTLADLQTAFDTVSL